MYAFQYKHGDRPLEGYTIQRAAGRGGFGEVYYAVSDSGREVALKCITGYQEIELRGISQCMNLKSPHLVTIFDVKYNAEGRPFVIMEYVSGPSLRQLLDEHPSGLGEQKAAFFLREIAKGLTFLHDCGIVHRDLKPGNIFYENGYVKIGDYGLSKAITTSQHSGQTVTVGTVHYMAPEVGAGKYDRSIDIYALGAVLYEMLTGVPPFVGASPSEVLLKHLSAMPDCSGISEPFATVIKRAMSKDPAQRYQSVQEMVEAVFGAAHVQQSMSVFSADELSMVAGRVARKFAASGGAGSGSGAGRAGAALGTGSAPGARMSGDRWGQLASRLDQIGQRIVHRGVGLSIALKHGAESRDLTVPIEDPLPQRARIMLAIVSILVVSAAAAIFSPHPSRLTAGIFVALAIGGAVVGLEIFRSRIWPHLQHDSPRTRRLITGAAAAMGIVAFSLIAWLASEHPSGTTWIGILAPFFLCDVGHRWLRADRPDRVRLGPALGAGFVAFMVCAVFGGWPHVAVAVVAGAALASQAISPWSPRFAKSSEEFDQSEDADEIDDEDEQPTAQASPAATQNPAVHPVSLNPESLMATDVPPPQAPAEVYWSRAVPLPVRLLWLAVFALTLSLSVAFFVAAGVGSRGDFGPFIAAAGTCVLLSVLFFYRAMSRTYYGIWNYLLRPLLITACAIAVFCCAVLMGTQRMSGEQIAVATFFIVFPTIVASVAVFVPGRTKLASPLRAGAAGASGSTAGGAAASPVDRAAPRGAMPEMNRRHKTARRQRQRAFAARVDLGRSPGMGGGLLSFLAGLLLFIGTLAGLGLALHLPHAIAAGVFDPALSQEIQRNVFNGYSGWPVLTERIAVIAVSIVMLLAVVLQIFARRRGGVMHMLRGIIGTAGLIVSLLILASAFRWMSAWPAIQPLVQIQQFAAAMDVFLNHWSAQAAITAGVVFVLASVVLAWAPRRATASARAIRAATASPPAPPAAPAAPAPPLAPTPPAPPAPAAPQPAASHA
ncbi:serine/threonine-protein kinase [Fontivita pretiosa]|uniref:serine/threonine-protein kinase n=1 Tax=Fontivita pretiosa TaxID=2989684 RepID=UPI003D16F879